MATPGTPEHVEELAAQDVIRYDQDGYMYGVASDGMVVGPMSLEYLADHPTPDTW